MCHARLLSLAALSLIAATSYGGMALAGDSLNILITGEHGDRNAVPQHSRVYKAAVDEISAILQDEGFAVYDEAAITVGAVTRGRNGRSDVELIDAARSAIRPPLDIAVVFSLYVRAEEFSYTKKIGSQITARLLSVMTGRHLGNFKVDSPRSLRAAMDCHRECLTAVFERDTRRLSRELGHQLAQRLTSVLSAKPGHYDPSNKLYGGMPAAYSVIFEGFSAEEVFEIEEYLVVFSGYRHHRPISTANDRHEYSYETASARGRLNRNLSKMLDYLKMPGQVDLSGNVFTVKKAAVAEGGRSWDDW